MSTKADWMAAVASGKCVIGMREYLRNSAEEAAERAVRAKRVAKGELVFGLEGLLKTHKPKVRGGQRAVGREMPERWKEELRK